MTPSQRVPGAELGYATTRPIWSGPSPAELLAVYIESDLEFIAEQPTAIRAVIEIAANARTDDGAPLDPRRRRRRPDRPPGRAVPRGAPTVLFHLCYTKKWDLRA
ncbi:hypothetical protein [Asanoa iriomotensis]|uniref:Uncharacterized protein n=1 Tax=Asanoa iriomotensis TaxID=234613 RepID=A0ABQ4CBT9_9ACTN|nr:hypothetical protein [Asanoa iriomotensis]GIF60239.1 hypothetical protein Air01nite_63340 [Asanoa iriomotensis]